MILYLGGKYNGKLDLVEDKHGITLTDCENADLDEIKTSKYLYNYQALVKRLWQEGLDPIQFTETIINNKEVIVSNNILNGVVPIDKFTREYRDMVGTTYKLLAKKAKQVVEIKYGIEVRLK